jgi:NADH-quinone oxidoreductase subunit K
MSITLTNFLLIGAGLFCIGLYMLLARRNAIQVLMGIELIINAAILNLVAFGKYDKLANSGQSFALFAIVLAAAAVAVALAIILNVYRQYKTIDPNKVDKLRG